MNICGRLTHNNLLQYVDNFRIEIYRDGSRNLDRKNLGQFFTPIEIAQQMAHLLGNLPENIRILDPGAGTGMLSAAVVSSVLGAATSNVKSIEIDAYEIDTKVSSYLRKTFEMCAELCARGGVDFSYRIFISDFIDIANPDLYSRARFDIAILNPPYRKIRSGSNKWHTLKRLHLPTSNLYAAFMSLASILLKHGGQLVSISPRSFCNGPYFLPFRRALLTRMSISHVHVYNSRTKAFSDARVLQENIIMSAIKSLECRTVSVTASEGPLDKDISYQRVPSHEVINRRDRNLIIRMLTDANERRINKLAQELDCFLYDLNLDVSTGRVVDFRAREFLRMPGDSDSVPLLLPAHFEDGFVKWPIHKVRKHSAIDFKGSLEKLLIRNDRYVLVKRFTSKEQRRRISAAILEPADLHYEYIGIENHLNYFHHNGAGLSLSLAKGLTAFLNSSFIDQYFRSLSGHTQVNAADLRSLRYPDSTALVKIGNKIGNRFPAQRQLDKIVAEELGMESEKASWSAQTKIENALEILKAIGVPRAQQNDRSALTLLALANIRPTDQWADAAAPLLRIVDMMEFFSEHYGKSYMPNTRETIRRQTIHQFWQLGMIVPNPDDPNRAINSPKYCYQVAESLLTLLRSFESATWTDSLTLFQIEAGDKLTALDARARTIRKIPVTLPDGSSKSLTAGGQNELIKSIVEEFCPRFAKGGEVLYLGDAGEKLDDAEVSRFNSLGIRLDAHGKMPDVVVYLADKNWLILIEAVTSHGPVDKKRYNELNTLFSQGKADLVFVTAFPSRRSMTKYLNDISWETEVWVADSPDHLIHFDGERFLGPYSSN